MATQVVAKVAERMPSVFDDFFKPWNEWFDGGLGNRGVLNVPAVNITEQQDAFQVMLVAPGMKKQDFRIDVDGNLLTISSEKEERQEDNQVRYTRKEYNYSSFQRSFTLPEEVNKERIEARYEEGLLKLHLPKKEEARKSAISKHIDVK